MEWRERLTLIWTMVRKDLAHAGIPILACAVVAATIAFLLGPAALASSRFPTAFRWFDSSLRPFFAISAALTGFTFAITFYEVHGGEIRSGTIRSIILYPVDANDIAFAKLGSALVITFILTTILFFGALAPFFALGIWPVLDFLAIHLMALGAGFVSLSTGVFLAHVLAHYAKRIVISPAGLGTLFIIGSMLLTELIANGIAFQITLLLARSRDQFPTPEETRAALRQQDAQLARLVEGIEARGLWRELTLLVVSDHGMLAAEEVVDARDLLYRAGLAGRAIGVSAAPRSLTALVSA